MPATLKARFCFTSWSMPVDFSEPIAWPSIQAVIVSPSIRMVITYHLFFSSFTLTLADLPAVRRSISFFGAPASFFSRIFRSKMPVLPSRKSTRPASRRHGRCDRRARLCTWDR